MHVKPQTPTAQVELLLGREGQGVHPPHVLGSLLRSASQPGEAEQSPYPESQSSPQLPPEQVVSAWGPVGHTLPQAPQLDGSVSLIVSQPSIESQSERPASQEKTQLPAEHEALAPGASHSMSQPPQCRVSVAGSVSQPGPSVQSMKPATHSRPQLPDEHTATWFASPVGQASSHAPQCSGCESKDTHVPSHRTSSIPHVAASTSASDTFESGTLESSMPESGTFESGTFESGTFESGTLESKMRESVAASEAPASLGLGESQLTRQSVVNRLSKRMIRP